MTTCSEPGCDRRAVTHGLCQRHYQAEYRRRRRASDGQRLATPYPIEAEADWVLACPNELVPLASQVADLDAKAIVRIIWPHLLEAHLAGIPPFTAPRQTEPA